MNKEVKIEKLTGKQAFVLAVMEAKNAGFNASNPHFDSKYANEKACKEATDPALHKYGLVMIHHTHVTDSFHLITQILDMDGEPVASSFYPLLITKPQDMGSQITYAKRYNRCMLMGIIADKDDDGNAAQDARPYDFEAITTEQAEIIKGLIEDTKSNTALFLKAIHAESIEEIASFNFDIAKEKLEAKKKLMEAKNGTA